MLTHSISRDSVSTRSPPPPAHESATSTTSVRKTSSRCEHGGGVVAVGVEAGGLAHAHGLVRAVAVEVGDAAACRAAGAARSAASALAHSAGGGGERRGRAGGGACGAMMLTAADASSNCNAMAIGYLGLGSNVGDRRANLQAAVDALAAHGVRVLASSSTYDTDPVGEILDQPDFLNACLRVETALGPDALLDACKAVERELGRRGRRPAPRPAPDRRRRAAARRGAVRHRAADAAARAGARAALRPRPAARARPRADDAVGRPAGRRARRPAGRRGRAPRRPAAERAGSGVVSSVPWRERTRQQQRRRRPTRSEGGRRRNAAEEARTLVSAVTVGYLATRRRGRRPVVLARRLRADPDGNPVLLVSTMAEHGRNLAADPRASLAINDPSAPGDPLDRPRITLAGRVVRPEGEAAEAALDAHVAAIPGARLYAGWDDFSLWVLEVRARALGRRLRADGHGQPRGVPRRRARPDAADRRQGRRAPQQEPRRRACWRSPASWPARAAPSRPSAPASTATAST